MILAIEGPNGCGKTTFIEQLKKEMNDREFVTLNIKEHSSLKESILNKIKNRDTNNFTLDEIISIGTCHLELISKAEELSDQGKMVFLDRSIASFYVYQYVLYEFMGHNETCKKVKAFIKNILIHEANEITTIYMDIPYTILKNRLERRGDSEHLLTDLKLIVDGYKEYFAQPELTSCYRITSTDIRDCLDDIKQLCYKRTGEYCA